MNESKAIRFSIAREVFVAALATNNPLSLPVSQNIVDHEMVVPLYPDLVKAWQLTISIQIIFIETLVPLPFTKLEALPGLHALQANFIMQGADELLNNMFNII